MGQTRTDSNQQVAAKRRGAEKRRCPYCGRGNALSRIDDEFIRAKVCRYCGYERGYDRTTQMLWTKEPGRGPDLRPMPGQEDT